MCTISRVLDLVRELEDYGCRVAVYDPMVGGEALEALGVKAVSDPCRADACYDAVVLAVPHRVFREKSLESFLV